MELNKVAAQQVAAGRAAAEITANKTAAAIAEVATSNSNRNNVLATIL